MCAYRTADKHNSKTGSDMRLRLFDFSAVNMQFKLSELKQTRAQLDEELAQVEDRLLYIRMRLDSPITDEYIRRVAREKLNYRDPDEIIFFNDLAD